MRSDKTGGLTSTKVRTTSVRTTKVRTTNVKMTNVRSTRIITGKTNKLISSEQKMQNCNYRYPDKRHNIRTINEGINNFKTINFGSSKRCLSCIRVGQFSNQFIKGGRASVTRFSARHNRYSRNLNPKRAYLFRRNPGDYRCTVDH